MVVKKLTEALHRFWAWLIFPFHYVPKPLTKEQKARARRNTIEIVKRFRTGRCEKICPALHHYRMVLDDGTVIPRISVVEIMSMSDWLAEQGISIDYSAEVYQLKRSHDGNESQPTD